MCASLLTSMVLLHFTMEGNVSVCYAKQHRSPEVSDCASVTARVKGHV